MSCLLTSGDRSWNPGQTWNSLKCPRGLVTRITSTKKRKSKQGLHQHIRSTPINFSAFLPCVKWADRALFVLQSSEARDQNVFPLFAPLHCCSNFFKLFLLYYLSWYRIFRFRIFLVEKPNLIGSQQIVSSTLLSSDKKKGHEWTVSSV